MRDIHVIDDPAAATVAREPTRSRLLAEPAAPASAATRTSRVGLIWQKLNCHLNALEAQGLVQERLASVLEELPAGDAYATIKRDGEALLAKLKGWDQGRRRRKSSGWCRRGRAAHSGRRQACGAGCSGDVVRVC